MTVVAIVLLLGAVVLGALGFLAQRKRKALVTTETLTVSDLRQLRDAAVGAAGPGSFRYRCEVVGRARPPRAGPLKAELSGVECVWHRHVVTHKYWDVDRDSKGRRRRRRASEKVADHTSERGFGLRDDTGALAIDPKGAEVDHAEKVHERFEEGSGSAGTSIELGGFSINLGGGSRTIGYQYEEWAVRPDQQLFVLGDVVDQGERLVMVKPTEGPYVVSTRSEEQVLQSETQKRTWFSVCAGVAAVAGVALLVASLVL